MEDDGVGAMQSSGKLRLLQRGPDRRGEAAGLLGGRFPWLEALRLELELGRARGSFGFCREDQTDEAKLLDYSEEGSRG